MVDLGPVLLVKLAGFGGFLWLGLFILSRTARQTTLSIVATVGMQGMAAYFFASALIGNNNVGLGMEGSVLLERWCWWTTLLPGAFWFHLALLINRQVYKNTGRWTKWLVGLVYGTAVLIGLIGSVSDLFLDYTHSRPLPHNYIYTAAGSAYSLYILYTLFTLGGGFFFLLTAWRSARVRPSGALTQTLSVLLVGGLLFLIGGVWLDINFYYELQLSELWGHLFLLTGFVLLGLGVAHYSLLLEGQDVQRDFIYSFTLNALVCLIYGIILALSGANSTLTLLLIVGLAVLSHTIFDFYREVVDRLFFSQSERHARSEARAFATALASQPTSIPELQKGMTTLTFINSIDTHETDEPLEMEQDYNQGVGFPSEPEFNQKIFNDIVRKALTGLKNPPEMIKSPLLTLHTVENRLRESGMEDNRLNRVAVLREWLIRLIEELRPAGSAASGTGDAWRFYNVLYYPYVREISKKNALPELRRLQLDRRQSTGQEPPGELERVLEWLVDVDENTFYKWQRKASDTIAAIIREQEIKVPVVERVG